MLALQAVVAAAACAGGASDIACSLNGVMSGGKCKCEAPWTGPVCAKLDIRPKKKDALPAYGFAPNVTSWGGNVIQNDAGTYDLWVSEMVGGCGLNTWTKNSRVVHATSATMGAPFTFKDVALPVWAHNAAPVRAPKTHTACPGCYYLFHIGEGHHTTAPQQCGPPAAEETSPASAGGDASPPCVGLCANSSSLVHRSRTPDGPWEPLPSIPGQGCNNPAPAFARNGTLFVLCSSSSIWRTDDPTLATQWQSVSRINLNDSPWTAGGHEYLRVEDPYLYMDRNENWHLLVHLYDYRDGYPINPKQTMPILVSGHAFSTDLQTLHYSVTQGESLGAAQPFDPVVRFDDGSVQNFSTFERPHFVCLLGQSPIIGIGDWFGTSARSQTSPPP